MFDYIDHDLLRHKLLEIGIDDDIYRVIKSIYTKPESCVAVRDRLSGWFPVKSSVRQGDSLSPILFAVCINDLADDLRRLGKGISIGDDSISILMYADDVVLLSGRASDAQT